MAIKTIDTQQYSWLEFEGTKVGIRVLTNGQLQRLSEEFDAADTNIDSKLAVLAPYIKIVDVAPELMAEFLGVIADLKTQLAIVRAVFSQNRISLAEEGNSGSSSAGSASASLTGDLDTATTAETKTLADALFSEAASLEQ